MLHQFEITMLEDNSNLPQDEMDCQECVMSLRRESILSAPIVEECNNLDGILNCRFKSAVLDRFPLTDHADTALPPQICMFALPEGVILRLSCPLPTSYVVVFTSNEVVSFRYLFVKYG